MGVLVLATAAIYYEWRGALGAAGALILAQGLAAYLAGFDWPWIALLGVGIIATSVLMGVLSRLLMIFVRQNYQRLQASRREGEKRAQRQERERLQAFYSMVETLSASINYQVVLDTTLDLSAAIVGETAAENLVSAVLLFSESGLSIEASRKMPAADQRQQLAGTRGVLAEVIQSGEPALVDQPGQDPELGLLISVRACQSALLLPLRRGLNAFGLMLYAHPDSEIFTQEQADSLQMISHQAVIAIQNARLFQDLELEKARMEEAQEEARKKLARDLHDGPIQTASAIVMRTSLARKMLERDAAQAETEMARVEDLARRNTQELRHMLFTLRPLVLESEGLEAALKAMAEKMRDTYQQNVLVEVDPALISQLEMGKQTVVFYLAEEAVNNARKHAEAQHIWVRFKRLPRDPEIAVLEIADDGKGFDTAEVNSQYDRRGSLGMVNLRERTDMVNGLLKLQSAVGKGTRVQVIIPLSEDAADRLQRGLPVS
uniref:Signal transduction histidine kinase n=1 Tax=Levilinea saccharolytica TaxID=229921 RepID=A0A0M8JQ09_9CHLR|nr:signal transduction histidine kinase [Levilinea saccharolytica]